LNKKEKLLLHGLYNNRQIVNDDLIYSSNELYWLLNKSFKETRKWRGEDGRLKTDEIIADNDYLVGIGSTKYAVEKPLSYLEAAGFISYQKSDITYRISITGIGVDMARDLSTLWGRTNIYYKKYKDGILGLIITILVSLVTALLTTSLANR